MNGRDGGRIGAFAAAAAVLCLVTGCDKKDDTSATPSLAPSASNLAPSVAEGAAGVKTIKFTIDPASASSIDMPAPIEHIKAETTAAAGSLDVDLMNLANSRGEVKIDLGTLKMHTFGDDSARNDAEGRDAKTWLEINAMDAGPSADQAAANRWVVFAIRSIDGLSAPDVTKVAATKDGADDVREVTLTAHGDFLLHGRKVSKDANLVARFHYPSGAAPTSKPTRLDIATKVPVHVSLEEHDVRPRDSAGALKLAAAGLLGTKVAKVADIVLDLHATPAP
jgi:hypothetical protein